MLIYINSIRFNNSHVDGPGIRSVLFLQGCNLRCKGCQNQSTWDITKGKPVEITDLVAHLTHKVFNKKITISGGEPLYQKEALKELINQLNANGFDIALYTGHVKEEVPLDIISKVKYLKTGSFIQSKKTSTMPFVGSSNQIFEEVKHETIK